MSTQNFLSIPKIILRKLCGEPKHANTSAVVWLFTVKIPQIIRNHEKTTFHMLGNGMGPLISQSLGYFLSDVDGFRRIDLGVGMF